MHNPKGSGTSPQSDYVLKRTKLKHPVCFTIQNRGGRRLSGQPRPSTQVTAPRGTFPRSRTTSPGRTTTGYTQTTPLRAEGVPSAAWNRRLTRDRRPRRSKQGLLCRLAIARSACSLLRALLPGARPGARWTIAHQQFPDDISSSESRCRVDQAHAASCALSGTPWDAGWDGTSRWDVRIIVPSGQGANIEWR